MAQTAQLWCSQLMGLVVAAASPLQTKASPDEAEWGAVMSKNFPGDMEKKG